jgi:hypothetical protein
VGYVDLRKRQTERAQDRRKLAGFWREVGYDPYLSMVAGMVLGFLVSLVSLFVVGTFLMRSPSPLLIVVIVALIMLLAFLALGGIWRLRLRSPGSVRTRFGAEKQLLVAIQDSGGSITPIEAALRTSLTVDEADEILSRLANRGHLLVESRDGVLCYALPGRPLAGL